MAKQDTGKFRKNTKDQFYTNENVAKNCIERITALFPDTCEYLWVEPSAGNGAFLKHVEFEKIGLDLDPKAEDIETQDYLTWEPPASKDIIVFGNPPFGRQSSLAKAFIARSCRFAKIIAFILPRSFTKPSMFGAFNLKFHLVESVELEKDSFVLNGSKYDVPSVFQIWEKKDHDRPLAAKIEPAGFRYVKPPELYDIAFRRVGVYAGKCYKPAEVSVQSHYFIKFEEADVDAIIAKINAHTFPSNTLGPRSLSKSEVNIVLNRFLLENTA